MKLYHIVAYAKETRVIGKNGKLPWHFPEDLKHFKSLTMGNTLIMGRKTFEAIGKVLPGRDNFVLTRQKRGQAMKPKHHMPVPFSHENLKFFDSLQDALTQARTEKVFIIGGAEIFRQTMDLVDGIYLTRIHEDYEGDTFYPEIPSSFKEKTKEILQENPLIEVIFYENTKKI
ncbi:MAG: dihydrofolate reductase [Candidatus Omnitrophica bacterium]|nr:dihydrofolate reductase [Candidatus Omnitrophota bacterium]